MENKLIKLWDTHKGELQTWFTTTEQSAYRGYKDIVAALFTHVINKGATKYDIDKITVIDDGDYQGTQLFFIPTTAYQPDASEYLWVSNYYGSCSGCDTLQAINDYEDGLPTPEQVQEYMGLALHLIQRMKPLETPNDAS